MQKWERRKYTCCNLHKHLFLSKSFPIYRNVNYRTLPSKTLYVNSFMGQTFILWWFYESGDLNDIFLAGLITVQNKNAHRSKKNIYIYDFFLSSPGSCPNFLVSIYLVYWFQGQNSLGSKCILGSRKQIMVFSFFLLSFILSRVKILSILRAFS